MKGGIGMKLSDMIISMIIKKGIINEIRNMECDVDIPDTNVKVKIKAEHITIKLEKNGD